MLTEILMESLMSMDEDTLDYVLESCDDSEIELISEATRMLTKSDKDDIDTIERIQRKARSSGWGNVPKVDRDKFVDIMSNTDNLEVLKKAKKLGEREASHDDHVKNALKALGMTAGGAGIGAGVGGGIGIIKGQNAALKDTISQANNNIDKYNAKVDIVNRFNKLQGDKANAFGRRVANNRRRVDALLQKSRIETPDTPTEVPSVTTTNIYKDTKNAIDTTGNKVKNTLSDINDKVKDATGIDGTKIKNTFDTWLSDANTWLKDNTGFDAKQTANSIKDATSGLVDSGKSAIDNGVNAIHTATGPAVTANPAPMFDEKCIKAAQNINRAMKDMPNTTVIDVPRMGQFTPNGIRELIMTSAQNGAVRGAGVGALTGASLSAILTAAKNAKRYNKDKKDVMAQGDAMHPDAQWKYNRKNRK